MASDASKYNIGKFASAPLSERLIEWLCRVAWGFYYIRRL